MCIRDSSYCGNQTVRRIPVNKYGKLFSLFDALRYLFSRQKYCILILCPVSYTHLDVYKRQGFRGRRHKKWQMCQNIHHFLYFIFNFYFCAVCWLHTSKFPMPWLHLRIPHFLPWESESGYLPALSEHLSGHSPHFR